MLSEVAQYHSELSGTNANSSIEVPMQEKLANIRLVSTCGKQYYDSCIYVLKVTDAIIFKKCEVFGIAVITVI